MSHVVQVTRTVNASPEIVFDAWTDPDQMRVWLCPDPGVVGEVTCEPVVGGRYRIVMVFDQGGYEVTGRYLVVRRPDRLVFTWCSNGVDGQETQVTVTLDPVGGDPQQTRMTILHELLPNVTARDGLRGGWANLAGKLDAYLQPTGAVG